mgnify:CR=1 FL=1
MLKLELRTLGLTAIIVSSLLLQACGQSEQAPEQKVEIKAAPKITNDATEYAQRAWVFINEVDGLVYNKQRHSIRRLTTDWCINVKKTGSVTEGKYALCRKALTSLEVWARETLDGSSSVAQKQSDYERDKAQCRGAIDNPSLGNTDPKKVGV